LFALETKWKKQQITACKTHCWFSVSCALFLLFSFCASGKISGAKPQRVLLANRYLLFWRKKLRWKLRFQNLILAIENWRK